MRQINFALIPEAGLEDGKMAVSKLLGGWAKVRQVFPDETDAELCRMFVLDVKEEEVQDALELLHQADIIFTGVELVPLRRHMS